MVLYRGSVSSLVMIWSFLIGVLCLFEAVQLGVNAKVEPSSYSTTATAQGKTKVRRERHLDYWDSDTLAYYLDHYNGYDVAIMFYAQWDRNSHALAPLWSKIATHMDAGSSQSRLIMALFDCELNYQHMELCKALSVTHYPTLMFVGAGPYHDTDPITGAIFGSKSAGPMGPAPVRNAVKFQGNWQYGDAIMDWIRTMQALSNWHTWSTEGFGKRLRKFFLPHKTPKTSLPVGVPGKHESSLSSMSSSSAQTSGASSSSSSSSWSENVASTAKVLALESELESTKKENKLYESAVVMTDAKLDSVLFPGKVKGETKNYTDIFELLHQKNAWDPKDVSKSSDILLSCALETAMDYCQRLATHVATEMIDELEAKGTLESLTLASLEEDAEKRIHIQEPYCKVLEVCLGNGMEGEQCRPKSCPFQDELACRFMTSCLDANIQKEYADALEKLGHSSSAKKGKDDAKITSSKDGADRKQEKNDGGKKKKSAWGL